MRRSRARSRSRGSRSHRHVDRADRQVGRRAHRHRFVDLIVGDPDVADVNPLTDHALSILGKKIGTTRVSVYAEGKKLVGIFDVEVSYDITRLTNELRRRFPGSQTQGVHRQRPHHAVRRGRRCRHARQGGTIARQFGPEIINTVAVMSPQQVMLEVRFVEISRTAGRELGVQWNLVGNKSILNVGNRVGREQFAD